MKIETNTKSVKNVVIDLIIEKLPWHQGDSSSLSSLHDLLFEECYVSGSVFCNSAQDRKLLLEMRHDQLHDVIEEIDSVDGDVLCLLRYPERTLLAVVRHVSTYIAHEYKYAIDTVLELTPDTIANLIKQLEHMKES